MVGKGVQETLRGMAGDAIGIAVRVWWRGSFSYGYLAVVATGAVSGNACVIETAGQADVEKVPGVVTVTALGICRYVKNGLTDGGDTVVAVAAVAEDLIVIHPGDAGESCSRGAMARRAGVAGGVR